MSCLTVLLVAGWAATAGEARAVPRIELQPSAISLDSPATEEFKRPCLIRYGGGRMNVLSAMPSAPAISTDCRESRSEEIFVVTATLQTQLVLDPKVIGQNARSA